MESISTRLKLAKNQADLDIAVRETVNAKFASAKTRRRWNRQIETKTKELSK